MVRLWLDLMIFKVFSNLSNSMILSETVQPEEAVGDLTIPWRYLEGIGVKRCFSPFSGGR